MMTCTFSLTNPTTKIHKIWKPIIESHHFAASKFGSPSPTRRIWQREVWRNCCIVNLVVTRLRSLPIQNTSEVASKLKTRHRVVDESKKLVISRVSIPIRSLKASTECNSIVVRKAKGKTRSCFKLAALAACPCLQLAWAATCYYYYYTSVMGSRKLL